MELKCNNARQRLKCFLKSDTITRDIVYHLDDELDGWTKLLSSGSLYPSPCQFAWFLLNQDVCILHACEGVVHQSSEWPLHPLN